MAEIKLKVKLKGAEARSVLQKIAEAAPGTERDRSGFVARAMKKSMPKGERHAIQQ